jgi:hypothetical protein
VVARNWKYAGSSRYCIARFEALLPKGTSAELAKVYLAETTAARAQLADMEHRAAKDRAGNEHR